MNLKDIHIGQMIEQCVVERKVELSRICNIFKSSANEINEMYTQENLPTDILLKWSKLLEYDFFRLYSQHMILYAPVVSHKKIKTKLPQFRKNVYTKEVIDFILDQIQSMEMTRNEVLERYRIPKTTLYKWIDKYGELK